ncbi:MAG TPA: SDR family NAD(P)-dependent oxidoreductase [Acidimicrobiales bacterium]|nr:SDR family NAD(P)-dependent oxidoreductase [Acidimicrobiales bacterium]
MIEDLAGKVAVVTGGGSGIGRAMAERFAAADAKVVIGDIEPAPLDAATSELSDAGAEVHGVALDVTDPSSLDRLRDETLERFGAVHLVCANAGVAPIGMIADASLSDWRWVVDVNLLGVVHTTAAFLPILTAQRAGHLVLTASLAGLRTAPGLGPYCATKHAVVAIADTLRTELADTGVGVSVVCPSLVRTRIFDSERNRPDALGGVVVETGPARAFFQEALSAMGIAPAEVAERVYEAVGTGRFWVFPHPEEALAAAEARMSDIRASATA